MRLPSRLLVPLALAAAAFGLASCGGGGGESSGEAASHDSGAAAAGGGTPQGSASAGGGAGGASALDGSYHCAFYIGGTGLQTVPGFSISGASYTHEDGSSGTVAFDGSTAEFSGGSLNGQAAVFEPGTPARLRLYNEDRTRTVIDCDRS